jgi:hypothetical protein
VHDYVRYPGDLAPDTYCFCDYCLAQIPEYAGYYSAAHPDHALLAPDGPPIPRGPLGVQYLMPMD